ncbi:hypothetical protein [Corynebacterium glyciniphilum]|uniref:hypothetical protein n=1 Tax=Corynebacterium glyciniphilum TaxID=1404244 RepID=UPI00264FBA02|nr:hypothetical protein [Corynebacterium glyciniphilum]MDN6707342.1 hypothetical protein [Corynebacterium glyciniphilum]
MKHDDEYLAAMARHPAGKNRKREPEEPSLRELIEAEFAIVIAFVLGGTIAGLIAAQAWHAWGWVGLTGAAAIIVLIALAAWDRR